MSSQEVPTHKAPVRQRRATFSYLGLFQASPLERIRLIQGGIPATEAKRILAELVIGHGAMVIKALRLSARTAPGRMRDARAKPACQGNRLKPRCVPELVSCEGQPTLRHGCSEGNGTRGRFAPYGTVTHFRR